jgi:hypothetical protein
MLEYKSSEYFHCSRLILTCIISNLIHTIDDRNHEMAKRKEEISISSFLDKPDQQFYKSTYTQTIESAEALKGMLASIVSSLHDFDTTERLSPSGFSETLKKETFLEFKDVIDNYVEKIIEKL